MMRKVDREPSSFIDDEDIRFRLKEYINERIYNRKKGEKRLRIEGVRQWINGILLRDYLEGDRGVSYTTVYRWMGKLGFRWRRNSKTVYVDGHERPDVKKARQVFTAQMAEMRKKMVMYGGPNRDLVMVPAEKTVAGEVQMVHIKEREVPPTITWRVPAGVKYRAFKVDDRGELEKDEKGQTVMICKQAPAGGCDVLVPSDNIAALQQWHKDEDEADSKAGIRRLHDDELLVRIDHDETTFKENDDGGVGWEDEKKGSKMKKKGEGRAVHVSDYISERTGKLEIAEERWLMAKEDCSVGGKCYEEVVDASGAAKVRSGVYGCREKNEAGESVMTTRSVQEAVQLLEGILSRVEIKEGRYGMVYNVPYQVRITMAVGKNQDGFWNSDRMAVQAEAVKIIYAWTHPLYSTAVHVFDNSSGHNAYEADALLADRLNKTPGGKQSILRSFRYDDGRLIHTTFMEGEELCKGFTLSVEDPNDAKKKIKAVFVKDDVVSATNAKTSKLIGVAKGADYLIAELGLSTPGLRLYCKTCEAKARAAKEARRKFNEGEAEEVDDEEGACADETEESVSCCMRRIIANIEAFKLELNKLEKVLTAAGYIVLFLPKFSPELNPIERFWAYLKRLCRDSCEYSMKELLELLPALYAEAPVSIIRSHYHVAWAYLDAYNLNVQGYMSYRSLTKELNHRGFSTTLDAILGAGTTEGGDDDAAVEAAIKANEEAVLAALKQHKSVAIKGYVEAFRRFQSAKKTRDEGASDDATSS
jgi:predicted secreted protein